jgi:hypothetical protein
VTTTGWLAECDRSITVCASEADRTAAPGVNCSALASSAADFVKTSRVRITKFANCVVIIRDNIPRLVEQARRNLQIAKDGVSKSEPIAGQTMEL